MFLWFYYGDSKPQWCWLNTDKVNSDLKLQTGCVYLLVSHGSMESIALSTTLVQTTVDSHLIYYKHVPLRMNPTDCCDLLTSSGDTMMLASVFFC